MANASHTTDNLVVRLRSACAGHPTASIKWSHRLLRDADDEIERLRAELEIANSYYAATTE